MIAGILGRRTTDGRPIKMVASFDGRDPDLG
jgi:hypothetical protein